MNTTRDKTQAPIQLNTNSLHLQPEVLTALKAKVGDRLCIRFRNNTPILATATAMGEDNGGNLITKSNTVSCRGKTGETLATFGTEFSYELEDEGYLVLRRFNAETAKDALEQIVINKLDAAELFTHIFGDEHAF